MRHAPRATLLAVLLLVPAAPADARHDRAQRALVREVNEVRAAHGRTPLRVSRSLTRQSRAWSRRNARSGRLDHASMSRACRRHGFARMSEVLAVIRGARPRSGPVVRAWMRSRAHRAVLLDPGMRFIGAGRSFRRADRTTWWVARVGRR